MLPAAAAAAAALAAPPSVQLLSGAVEGRRLPGGVREFLGVPYAAPPTGDLRWRPPQPAARWAGTRAATRYGGVCPQQVQTGPESTYTFPDGVNASEDCLYVDVWLPAAAPAGGAPSIVWFHGGGLEGGAGEELRLNASAWAARGVAAVAVNYRLGLLGFLALPALRAGGGQSGNYGLLDQRAALQWVHDNAAALGADPARVTIAGQSAGGTSVCLHMLMPPSAGLFAAGVVQSGACVAETAAQADAEAAYAAAVAPLGCGGDGAAQLACLRGKSPADLLSVQRVESVLQAPTAGGMLIRAVVDGANIPAPPITLFRDGRVAAVPLIAGNVADEVGPMDVAPVPRAALDAAVGALAGAAGAAAAQAAYAPLCTTLGCGAALSQAVSDYALVCPTTLLALARAAAGGDVYAYTFNHRPDYSTGIHRLAPQAMHADEIEFVHGATRIHAKASAADNALGDALATMWAAWATAPGAPPDAAWPRYANATGFARAEIDAGGPVITPAKGWKEAVCTDVWGPAYARAAAR